MYTLGAISSLLGVYEKLPEAQYLTKKDHHLFYICIKLHCKDQKLKQIHIWKYLHYTYREHET